MGMSSLEVAQLELERGSDQRGIDHNHRQKCLI